MANRYWVGGAGTWDSFSTANWSTTSGGASGASAPTAADVALFDANSGTGTCTTDATAVCSAITFDSATVTLTLGANFTTAGTLTYVQGSIDFAGFSLSAFAVSSNNSNTRVVTFGGGKFIITGNGASVWDLRTLTGVTFNGTPVADLTYSGATGTRTILNGSAAGGTEANSVSFNITAGADTITFASGVNVAIKNLNFTGFAGTWTATTRKIYGLLTVSSGMTLGAGTGATIFASTSGTSTITTNGKTLDFPLTFDGAGGTFEFADALTQGSTRAFTLTNGAVKLKNGVTSTVGAFATSGTNQKFLQSTVAGSQATLSQASGTVSASYLTIQDINATGGATWNAFYENQNFDGGNNTGWDFGIFPEVQDEVMYRIRSFTEARRF